MGETVKDCSCGVPVRLGAFKVSVNRKTGVSHYIDHVRSSPGCEIPNDFQCVMMKPYPKNDADRPRVAMVKRWDYQMGEEGA